MNASISWDCASKPNIYLAHHSTLDLNSLYKHVHFYKAAILTFARTLKDVTLTPSTSHMMQQSNGHPAQTGEIRFHKAFTISSWKIQGLRSCAFGLKSRNTDFIKEMRNTDIVTL